MENFVGYLASALIGVSLGLIGGGGSIITIPVLVYLFHIEPTLATAYSLFIVGITSLVGGIRSTLLKTVDFKSALLFSIPSTLAVYLTRRFLLPHIPENTTIGSFTLTKDVALMLFFSIIMVLAAVRMIRDKQRIEKRITTDNKQLLIIILQGFIVGIVTGIIGAGGGFLIIPALVLLVGLPMKKAIGTSLIVIAINSLIGFIGDMHMVREIDFPFMMILSALAVLGVFLGMYLSRFIDGKNLKSGFGWFALAMAIFIMIKEIAI
ncbi:MAG: permease [Marivirga sp.]|nr:permease [Marivirga sp.]